MMPKTQPAAADNAMRTRKMYCTQKQMQTHEMKTQEYERGGICVEVLISRVCGSGRCLLTMLRIYCGR